MMVRFGDQAAGHMDKNPYWSPTFQSSPTDYLDVSCLVPINQTNSTSCYLFATDQPANQLIGFFL